MKTMSSGRKYAAALFASAALVSTGIGLAMACESYAVLTERAPTISAIVATRVQIRPKTTNAIMVATGVLVGALVAHFTDWEP